MIRNCGKVAEGLSLEMLACCKNFRVDIKCKLFAEDLNGRIYRPLEFASNSVTVFIGDKI
jgi:hypothetical protein